VAGLFVLNFEYVFRSNRKPADFQQTTTMIWKQHIHHPKNFEKGHVLKTKNPTRFWRGSYRKTMFFHKTCRSPSQSGSETTTCSSEESFHIVTNIGGIPEECKGHGQNILRKFCQPSATGNPEICQTDQLPINIWEIANGSLFSWLHFTTQRSNIL
jgi:hypothetical protein